MYQIKSFVVGAGFRLICRAMCVLQDFDSRVKESFASLPEGYTLVLRAGLDGPSAGIKKENGRFGSLKGSMGEEKAIITFKSVGAAFLLMTGQLSIEQATAQHRFTFKGDINLSMVIVRCMKLAEFYLFPKLITKKLFDPLPKKEFSAIKLYVLMLFGRR